MELEKLEGNDGHLLGDDAVFDPNNAEQVRFLLEETAVAQFGFRIGVKAMQLVKEDGEFSLI